MAASDARPLPRKNTAYRITFPIFDADGDLVTGAATLDSEVSIDGGAFADCTNEATEVATSSGMYFLDLTAGEMNGDTISVIIKTSTAGAKTTPVVLYPEEAGDVRVNVTQVNGTNQTAGDLAAMITTVDDFLDTEIAAIKAKTDQLTFTLANKVDASIQAAGDFAQAAADKVWASATRTLTSIGASLVQEIWDRATSALTVAGSIGKLLVDNINATVGSRATQTSVDAIDDFIDTEVAAIKAKTDNLPSAIQKNTALNNFTIVMVDTADAPTTGLTVTAQRSIDGAALAACANSVTEVGSGIYKISLAASDLNGDIITFVFTATGAKTNVITMVTKA